MNLKVETYVNELKSKLLKKTLFSRNIHSRCGGGANFETPYVDLL